MIIYYNIIILLDHCRVCGPSLTETSLCGAWPILYCLTVYCIAWPYIVLPDRILYCLTVYCIAWPYTILPDRILYCLTCYPQALVKEMLSVSARHAGWFCMPRAEPVGKHTPSFKIHQSFFCGTWLQHRSAVPKLCCADTPTVFQGIRVHLSVTATAGKASRWNRPPRR
jgi:hypothetical protein